MNTIKTLWMLIINPPSAKTLAIKELESAKRSYLTNKTHCEYYQALYSFEMQRIARLEKYLEEPLQESPL
jgi:hypothetical protein